MSEASCWVRALIFAAPESLGGSHPPCLVGSEHRHQLPQGRPFGLLQEPGECPDPGTADGCHLLAVLPPLSSDVILIAMPHSQSPFHTESLPWPVNCRIPKEGSSVQFWVILPIEIEAVLNAAVRQRCVCPECPLVVVCEGKCLWAEVWLLWVCPPARCMPRETSEVFLLTDTEVVVFCTQGSCWAVCSEC